MVSLLVICQRTAVPRTLRVFLFPSPCLSIVMSKVVSLGSTVGGSGVGGVGGVGASSRDWTKESKLSRVFKNEPQVTVTKKIKALLTFYSQSTGRGGCVRCNLLVSADRFASSRWLLSRPRSHVPKVFSSTATTTHSSIG